MLTRSRLLYTQSELQWLTPLLSRGTWTAFDYQWLQVSLCEVVDVACSRDASPAPLLEVRVTILWTIEMGAVPYLIYLKS